MYKVRSRFTLHCVVHLLFAFFALVLAGTSAQAQQTAQAADPNLKTIRAILELPASQIDLAKTKLTIDRMIDPRVEISSTLQQLDAMANAVRARFPVNASSRNKLDALRGYLYQGGPWNNNQPFRYDLNDPLGHNVHNKLLPTYLATRKGNCVSMPLLFIILGQKLSLDVTASTAPEHVFVKYRDETGNLHNLETTSGAGFTRDAWMQQQMPMSSQALSNGIYMQPLTKKETVVVMAETLLDFYGQQGQEEKSIALAGLMLEYYPKGVSAMLHSSWAYYSLRQRHFVSKYSTPNDIPVDQRAYFAQLEDGISLWREKAEALGWREPAPDAGATPKQTVDRAKTGK